MEFQKFKKIPRLSRDCIITEKIDGTNGQIVIIRFSDFEKAHEGYAGDSVQGFLDKYCLYKTLAIQDENDIIYMFAGSKSRWLDTSSNGDNHGFAKWVKENAEELLKLGEGIHYGEWYGKGINRNYGLNEKRFALFNVRRWVHSKELPNWDENDKRKRCPDCCDVVPILFEGMFDTLYIQSTLDHLKMGGSFIVPGYMNPEGIIIYHKASGQLFKKTIENDEKPKNSKE